MRFSSHLSMRHALILAFLMLLGGQCLQADRAVAAEFGVAASGGRMRLPEDVAVTPERLYVADGLASLIRIFARNGDWIGDIGFPSPIAVGVLPDSTLVAASARERSVWLLSPDGRPLLALGRGRNEFLLPRNIVIDPERARIGVVDPPAGALKWYDYNGAPLDILDDRGNLPQDAVVMEGEIFLIDHPVGFTDEGEQTRGAAIRVFSAEGRFLRTLAPASGNRTTALVRPRSIAVGPHGNLLVIDGFHGVVMEISPDGERLATLAPAVGFLRGAGGAATFGDQLYVAVTLERRLALFDLSSQPDIGTEK